MHKQWPLADPMAQATCQYTPTPRTACDALLCQRRTRNKSGIIIAAVFFAILIYFQFCNWWEYTGHTPVGFTWDTHGFQPLKANDPLYSSTPKPAPLPHPVITDLILAFILLAYAAPLRIFVAPWVAIQGLINKHSRLWFDKPLRYDITAESIFFQSSGFSSRSNWSAYTRFAEDRHGFLLVDKIRRTVWLPFDGFASPNDIALCRQILGQAANVVYRRQPATPIEPLVSLPGDGSILCRYPSILHNAGLWLLMLRSPILARGYVRWILLRLLLLAFILWSLLHFGFGLAPGFSLLLILALFLIRFAVLRLKRSRKKTASILEYRIDDHGISMRFPEHVYMIQWPHIDRVREYPDGILAESPTFGLFFWLPQSSFLSPEDHQRCRELIARHTGLLT